MDVETQVLEVIQELQQLADGREISIREISSRLVELCGEELDRKITTRWVGYIIRRKLGLKTYRRAGNFYLHASEKPKLDTLFERCGLTVEHEVSEQDIRTSGLWAGE